MIDCCYNAWNFDFNPRSLAGATPVEKVKVVRRIEFQSTLPRGSDSPATRPWQDVPAISIHAPSRERLPDDGQPVTFPVISIHAPSRERRHRPTGCPASLPYFNPRSLAGATKGSFKEVQEFLFQSTLPRGSDRFQELRCLPYRHFNPRSLAGATITLQYCQHFFEFQSTLPRGSDHSSVHCDKLTLISIHAPSRERPYFWMFVSMLLCISIHAPSRERQIHNTDVDLFHRISIHAPSRERPQYQDGD